MKKIPLSKQCNQLLTKAFSGMYSPVDIAKIHKEFNANVKQYDIPLPEMKQRIDQFIADKSTDAVEMDNYFYILLGRVESGNKEEKLFLRFLEYFKTVSPERAAFYWEGYDEMGKDLEEPLLGS